MIPDTKTHSEMFRRQDKPPDTPSSPSHPKLSMDWMKVGESSIVSQIARSPGRSQLLQQSRESVPSHHQTQGQLSRLKIADDIKYVN